jgi:hypothetical protein
LNGTASTLSLSNAVAGASGTIVIYNGGGSITALDTALKTPLGHSIDWSDRAGTTSILSYYVAASDNILVNYIGEFS